MTRRKVSTAPKSPPILNPVTARIVAEMERQGIRPATLSRMAGLSMDYLRTVIRAGTQPKRETVKQLAEVLRKPAAFFYGSKADAEFSPVPVGGIDVIGQVEAGTWREALEWSEIERYLIYVPPDPRYAGLPRFALEVRGPSMDRLYPPGTIIVCVRLDMMGRQARSGERVVVQRANKTGEIEATVKEFVIDDHDRAWLWPRSTDPRFQQPFFLGERTAKPRQRALREHPPATYEYDGLHVQTPEPFDIIALVTGSFRRE